MKSRNFLHNNRTDTNGLTPSGFLLARASKASTTGDDAVRRFELQHNSSPRFARRRQERRQGQALLLAVLIMLLAALLSAGFLAVVSGNLNQSARIADKTRAIEASRAGIAYANAQLSGSSQGDLWRPIDVNPAPVPGSTNPDYNFYYSQLDKVQGWAAKIPPVRADFTMGAVGDEDFRIAGLSYRDNTYGKFPGPAQAIGDAPKFLVKVEQIPLNSTLEPDHRGEIKITSVGLSEDDPNVFHRSVAYKTGRKKSPWASALRSVSNWNFKANNGEGGVPFSAVDSAVTIGTPTINVPVPISNVTAFSNDDVPFNIVIVKKTAPTSVRGAVVTQVTPPAMAGNPAILTLARLDASVSTEEVIEKAAAIGTGSTIDLLNTGTATPPTVAASFPNYVQPNGIVANGSLWLQNQVQLSNLSKLGTKLFISGSLAIDDSVASVSKPVLPGGDVETSPGGNQLVPSNVNYPGNNVVLTAAAISNGVEKTDLINDGWNKIDGQFLGLDYSNSRDVEPFKPAKIDSAENLARYRALTRNSANGVYIDNRDDVEKVGTTPMKQAELIEMLTKPTSTANYARNDAAVLIAATNVSLEQRHLRGWVGPDEFLARGALVELIQTTAANPQLRVTYDFRSDTNPNGPEPTKTFRDANGNLLPGVYSQIIAWPANGTLFAEGNIRIRGSINLPAPPASGSDPYPSLTVVSLNNIYIEGSLSVDNSTFTPAPGTSDPRKKLMLLAKKNVIVNPTRAVLARTDVQTIATNTAAVTFAGTPGPPATSDTQTFTVANNLLFNQGDYVTIGTGQNKSVRGLITNVNPTNNEISVRTTDAFTLTPASSAVIFNVRSTLEERTPDNVAAPTAFFSLVNTENAINRRILVSVPQGTTMSTTNNNNKLIFDHVADRRLNDGLRLEVDDFGAPVPPRPATFVAELTNKQVLVMGTQDNDPNAKSIDTTPAADNNKILRTYNNYPGLPAPTNQRNFVSATNKTLNTFRMEIDGTSENNLPTPGDMGYRYRATLTNPLYGALPSHALTGIGLRYDPMATFTPLPAMMPSANNRRQDFNGANGFTIPLATTVEFDLNGTINQLRVIGETNTIPYLGFNPTFANPEDALTTDSSFYQPLTSLNNSTMDIRRLTLPIMGAPAGFTTFPNSIAMKRSEAYSDTATSNLLPDYRVRAMKVGTFGSINDEIQPTGGTMQIDAFVYAQEGSWFVVPGDYFRTTNPAVRGEKNSADDSLAGSYIDYNNNNMPDLPAAGQPTEYITNGMGGPKVADLNRNGIIDAGEREAALQFVRFNTVQIAFFGAIVENQTAIVADVADPAAPTTPVVKGAVQDWMDKWATYDDIGGMNIDVGKPDKFKLITYAYDPALITGSIGTNSLRVPVTDDLIYQQ